MTVLLHLAAIQSALDKIKNYKIYLKVLQKFITLTYVVCNYNLNKRMYNSKTSKFDYLRAGIGFSFLWISSMAVQEMKLIIGLRR